MESNKAMNIFLEGQPATVTHQSGTKICNHRTYKTSALKKWELTLHYGLLPFKPNEPLEGPICLQVEFGFKANRRKDINTYKLTRPDTDNMIKTLKDAMTKLDFWHDDAQVCHEICSKIYTDKPGIKIQILPMDATKGEQTMKTSLAFLRGRANRGKEMMVFDWIKAAQIIKELQPQEASAGLEEDWEWTSGRIFVDGKPYTDDYIYLASTWATPQLLLDGKLFDCYVMESEAGDWDAYTQWPRIALDILNS